MDLTETPVIYLIGAPRSGTTWLQRMLGSHPEIASPQETDLFSRYVIPLLETWRTELPESFESQTFEGWLRRRYKGLPAVLTTDDLIAFLRCFVAGTYSKLLERKTSAATVLEKNPEYSLCVDTIVTVAPHARFIHLIRDGRDAAASLRRAASGWGSWWAPSRMSDAAQRWKTYVEGARRAEVAPGGYLEVRYEELTLRGVEMLGELFDFCGVRTEVDLTQNIVQRYRPDSRTNTKGGIVWGGEVANHIRSEPEEPPGFVSDHLAPSWQETFSDYDRRIFDRIAGDCLIDLGYETDHAWSRTHGLRGISIDARIRSGELAAWASSLAGRGP